MTEKPRFITPEGFARLRAEYDELFGVERPKIVEVVSWAASLGDRSENADYLYGKKRLREIDRRLAHLARIMKAAKIVDPAKQEQRDQVRFGATVRVRDRKGVETGYRLVGVDETDLDRDWVSWCSPIARALLRRRLGEKVRFRFPAGEEETNGPCPSPAPRTASSSMAAPRYRLARRWRRRWRTWRCSLARLAARTAA